MVEHFYVKFGYPSCSGYFIYLAEKETDRQTPLKPLPLDHRLRG